MKNIFAILIALACLSLLLRKKYLEIPGEKPAAIADTADEIVPVKKQPLPKNFADVNQAFRKGEMEFARGNIELAEKWFIKTLALYEHHEEALNRLGVIAIQKNELLKAELLYRRLLSLNLKEPAYYGNYGRALYTQGKLGSAAQAYEMAVTLDPSKANRFISLGQIYYEMEKYGHALEKFLEAHRLEPRNLQYMELISDLYETMGKFSELEGFLGKILALNPYDEKIQKRMEGIKENKEIKPEMKEKLSA